MYVRCKKEDPHRELRAILSPLSGSFVLIASVFLFVWFAGFHWMVGIVGLAVGVSFGFIAAIVVEIKLGG